MMRVLCACLLALCGFAARGEALRPGRVELLCHRTANQDVPENTLESLEQAALLGCDVVEIDLRRTLDGKIVLNHDGFLERLTDGVGETEMTYYADLQMRDAGAWMGERFEGLHMALFADALRLAREKGIRLILDMKTKGIGADVLAILKQEGMLERVRFGGEWDDVKQLYPQANAGDETVWRQPGVSAEQVQALHREGKRVVVNFSANAHQMDLAAMKGAVAAGADGINVDFPRLGADAVGRPVEGKLAALEMAANSGESSSRAAAILELSRYRGFPLQQEFAHWLLDAEESVSRAAAVALVTARPRTPAAVFEPALLSDQVAARANAAWALGILGAPAGTLLPLLKDRSAKVQQAALLAIARIPGEVGKDVLLPLLLHGDVTVRGEAALALARHQPEVAVRAVPEQLQREIKVARGYYDDYARRGKPQLAQGEIAEITGYFRCEMKMMQAISSLKDARATQVLMEQAFLTDEDFSQANGMVAAFQLWDRLGADATATDAALRELQSEAVLAADRAEWMLVQAGPGVLPQVRKALDSSNMVVRERAIRILAWQGDLGAVSQLRAMQRAGSADAGLSSLAEWAIGKIESLHAARNM